VLRSVLGVFVVVLIGGLKPADYVIASAPSVQQPGQNATATASMTSLAPKPISPDAISGIWDYNDALSVDAATGRPERAPRSATQRAIGPPAAGTGTGTAPRAGGGGAPGGGGAAGVGGGRGDAFDDARRAMAAVIAAERRTYVRDLLEVPEQITVRATTTEVTFVDDLKRQQTYSTDGRLQKYQLSAARYEARGSWTDTYFRKDIQGANNFKMSETYFVSEDGNRLFVIIRIGDPKKPETLAGVNRVYDRIQGY
jgi:hypothetical protein